MWHDALSAARYYFCCKTYTAEVCDVIANVLLTDHCCADDSYQATAVFNEFNEATKIDGTSRHRLSPYTVNFSGVVFRNSATGEGQNHV